jgi:hypothetical protein
MKGFISSILRRICGQILAHRPAKHKEVENRGVVGT